MHLTHCLSPIPYPFSLFDITLCNFCPLKNRAASKRYRTLAGCTWPVYLMPVFHLRRILFDGGTNPWIEQSQKFISFFPTKGGLHSLLCGKTHGISTRGRQHKLQSCDWLYGGKFTNKGRRLYVN